MSTKSVETVMAAHTAQCVRLGREVGRGNPRAFEETMQDTHAPAAHTAGPWIVDDVGHVYAEPFICETTVTVDGAERLHKEGLIALVYTPMESFESARSYEDTSAANSRLIASAPDLLRSLKALLDDIASGLLVRDITHDGEAGWSMPLLAFVHRLQAAQAAIAKAEGRS